MITEKVLDNIIEEAEELSVEFEMNFDLALAQTITHLLYLVECHLSNKGRSLTVCKSTELKEKLIDCIRRSIK